MAFITRNINRLFARFFVFVLFFAIGQSKLSAQVDSLQQPAKDTVVAWDSTGKPVAVFDSTTFAAPKKKLHDPHKSTIRSLILPGWGQAYNREYWKIPIVWGALAIPGTTFFKNNSWYKDAKSVYNTVYILTQQGARDASVVSGKLNGDADYKEYWDKLYAINPATASTSFLSTVQSNRNFYRRNRDYSVLWLLILWGVNVADATVFGHLKNFDIGPDLSMQVNPTYIQQSKTAGISLLFNLK